MDPHQKSPWKGDLAVAGIVALPFLAWPGLMFRDSWETSAIYGACGIFALWLKSWWYRLFMILAVAMLLRYPVSISFYGMVMIVVFLAAANTYLHVDAGMLEWGIRIAGISMAVIVLLQLVGFIPEYAGKPTAFFNPDAAGVFFAVCFPALLAKKWWPASAVVAGCVALAGSTTGFASLAAASAVFAAISGGRLRYYALSGIVAAVCIWLAYIDPIKATLSCQRWTIWKHLVWTFRSEMFGRGIGAFGQTFNYFILGVPGIDHNWTAAHNEYLQTGYEFGAPGMLLIAAFLGAFLWRTVKHRTGMMPLDARIAAGMTAVAVSCFGWMTFHIAPLALVSVAWISMWIGRQKRDNRPAKELAGKVRGGLK